MRTSLVPVLVPVPVLVSVLALLSVTSACSTTSAGEGTAPTRQGRRVLNVPGRSDDLPYSHVVIAGDTVWVAGTIGIDPATGSAPADPAVEARLALDSVAQKLALAGLTMDDLVSMQVFCSDLSLYDTFNTVYRAYFEHGTFPARAFIGSGPLLRNGRFELCGIAVFP